MENTHRRKRNKPIKFIQEQEDNAAMAEVDRISHLPEPIIHHIMSILPTRCATKSSALSKNWNCIWSRFPVVDLDEVNLNTSHASFFERRHRFFRYLNQTLVLRCLENLDQLRICTCLPGTNEIYEAVDTFMDTTLRGQLKNLELKFPNKNHPIRVEGGGCVVCYKLPEVIYSSGSSLLSLRVEGCRFVEFENLGVCFPFLKVLSIKNSHIEGNFIERIIQGSPVMESLTIRSCHGLRSATIYHGNLKHVLLDLGSSRQMENCVIETPSLQLCKYKGGYIRNGNGDLGIPKYKGPSDINIYQCLHTFTLVCVGMKAELLNCMLSSLPNLKNVKIKKCWVSNRVIVSGENLTLLVIKDCYLDENVEIEARNLQTFSYSGNDKGFNFQKMRFQYLRTLSIIENNEMTGNDLEFVISGSGNLVSVVLISCMKMEYVTVISASLQSLVIEKCLNVKEVTLLSPQLLFLKYMGPALNLSSFWTSRELTFELLLTKTPHDLTENKELELFKLREFLRSVSGYAKSMTLVCECGSVLRCENKASENESLGTSTQFAWHLILLQHFVA